ncbi:pyrimidine-nucleoside phosphorylase [Paenibacillus macquariensis]|uniref:Pyrimidine-nucleoside phosphorylase n=1 Tax=Paenibacillus macquariensis TaxID=948756 RepID=A0ABY1JK01_9BACL|nr:pyrimidine-nucleoside phosphorylase [Paenibacillus macquariensis]
MINETFIFPQMYFIRGYVYQMSAWAMAVYYKGMTPRETGDLTLEMAQSGDQIVLRKSRLINTQRVA